MMRLAYRQERAPAGRSPSSSLLRGRMTINKLPIKPLAAVSLMLLLGFAPGCSRGQTAAQAPCYRDAVQTSPGTFLPMASGRLFQVYPTDNQISMGWRPLDRVIVCPIGGAAVEIINMTEKGAKVKAIQLFPLS